MSISNGSKNSPNFFFFFLKKIHKNDTASCILSLNWFWRKFNSSANSTSKFYRSTTGEILVVISQRVFKWGSANQFILNEVSSMLSKFDQSGQHRGYLIKDKLVSTTPIKYPLIINTKILPVVDLYRIQIL